MSKKNQIRQKKFLKTNYGEIESPFFMPDATRGFVKFLSLKDLSNINLEAVVVNTYHLFLRPGQSFFKKENIHKWGNWEIPVLSDSGGYQVFSLIRRNKKMGKITDKGAYFRSPLDGKWLWLTPEKSIAMQFDLGVDMMVVLDDPPQNNLKKDKIKQAVERTLQWARRSVKEYKRQIRNRRISFKKRPLLFAVIQGGPYLDLREYCLNGLKKIAFEEKDDIFKDWDGYGFGGRHVDSQGNFMEDILKATAKMIPNNKWKFALGIGSPEDIVKSVSMGWDMFDCVIPTREGRHGKLLIRKYPKIIVRNKLKYEVVNISNQRFKNNTKIIDKHCQCELCQYYNFSFLHHLFKYQDPLGMRLVALHNLKFYLDLMNELRDIQVV